MVHTSKNSQLKREDVIVLLAIITIFIILADQTAKYIVANWVGFGKMKPVIENFFYITNCKNYGAAWGILQDYRYLFITATVFAMCFMIYLMIKVKSKLFRYSVAFVMGGAIGNLIDRIKDGGVVDFLDFYFGRYHYPTFNIADIFIVIGTIFLIYYLIFNDCEKNKKNKELV